MFVIGTLVSTWLLAFAYKNTKHVLKHKLALKREAAVAKEMNAKVADDKKISKKEKDERILWKKNEVAEYEGTTFSASVVPVVSLPSSQLVPSRTRCHSGLICSHSSSSENNKYSYTTLL